MGNNKLLLIVEPKYAKAAMDIYQEMDKKKFFRAAILDTEKVMEEEHIVRQGALAEEVKAKEKYVQSYINFFLGNVMKCENIEELRECRIGVTPDCMLYHSYRLQHINPENYTRRAYIVSVRGFDSFRSTVMSFRRRGFHLRHLWKRQRNFWNWKQCHFRQRIISARSWMQRR